MHKKEAYMSERTEEQKVFSDPIRVKLGGRDYEIRPLVIRQSREWRKKLASAMADLPQYMGVDASNPDKFSEALNAMMVALPDQVVDLFFEYAKDLPREEIEDAATDDEIAKAFGEVIKLAFPLAGSLTQAIQSLSQ
jgi:hypothetical protein